MKTTILRNLLFCLPILAALLAAAWISQSGTDAGSAVPKPASMMATPF